MKTHFFYSLSLLFLSSLFMLSCGNHPDVKPACTIANISPDGGSAGTSVTITGTGFSATMSDNAVSFNGTTATITSASPTMIVVTAPNGGTNGPVTVTVFGKSTIGPIYNFASAITDISPKGGPAGTTVAISGTGFSTTASENVVTFNGVSATVVAASAGQLTVTAPSGGSDGNIAVTVNGLLTTGPKYSYYDWYAFGYHGGNASYWKNGVRVDLTSNNPGGGVYDLAVSGTDIYAVGYEDSVASSGPYSIYRLPRYWKNGVVIPIHVPSADVYTVFTGITVAGGDVYICGYSSTGSVTYAAKYWKNGVETDLTDGTTVGKTSDIAVLGTDIYVAGSEYPDTKYWKNGVATTLTSGIQASVGRITIAGSDIYIAGTKYYTALYWKNGVETPITDGTKPASAISVWASDGGIYVAGWEYNGTKDVAKFWNNGAATTLPATFNASTLSVAEVNGDILAVVQAFQPGSTSVNENYVFQDGKSVPPFPTTDQFTFLFGGLVVDY